MNMVIVRDAWEIDAVEEVVGVGYDRMRLQIAKYGLDEPPFNPCQVAGCGEPLEFGFKSLPTAVCQKGHIWYQVEGEWKLINLWRK